MKKWSWILCFCIVLGLSFGSIYFINRNKKMEVNNIQISNSIAMCEVSDLTRDSDLIIKGKVLNIAEARWNNERNEKPATLTEFDRIYTDVTVMAEETMKGDSDTQEVVVRLYYGTVDGFEISDDGEPNLEQGKEYILFLGYDQRRVNVDNSRNHYIVWGMTQGAFEIVQDKHKNSNDQAVAKSGREQFTLSELYSQIDYYMEHPVEKPRGNTEE